METDLSMPDEIPSFIHITQNEFLGRKHKKLKEEDIATCECKYDESNPETACGESCLNVLTNTECTPGYCPCSDYCRNQKFQKCEYVKTKLFKTEGRGWGLLADENIKAGQFIIEYCGEVISSQVAKRRSHSYEAQGVRDAYIISLTANYYIDATKKGSFARFVNHSCEPNCETRKWTVLGETRVGIFAKKDVSAGTELAYDYNFEWYGGATVRCLCRAANCSLFLGAKSHGFQEYNHLWEDGDDRYPVENIPLYDSAEDEPFHGPVCTTIPFNNESVPNYSSIMDDNEGSEIKFEDAAGLESQFSFGSRDGTGKTVEAETGMETKFSFEDKRQAFSQTNPMISRIRSTSGGRNYNIGSGPSSRRSPLTPKQKSRVPGKKYMPSKPVPEFFTSKEAREEIKKYEEIKNKATADLDSLYDEIRPAIEEHERDSQDNVPTSVAEKWIAATCSKWKAEFDFHFAIIENVLCPPKTGCSEAKPSGGDEQSEMKCSKN